MFIMYYTNNPYSYLLNVNVMNLTLFLLLYAETMSYCNQKPGKFENIYTGT